MEESAFYHRERTLLDDKKKWKAAYNEQKEKISSLYEQIGMLKQKNERLQNDVNRWRDSSNSYKEKLTQILSKKVSDE